MRMPMCLYRLRAMRLFPALSWRPGLRLHPCQLRPRGQGDIVDHEQTGYPASYSDNVKLAAAHLADGLVRAAGIVENPEEFARMRTRMRESVRARFSYSAVARAYLEMI